MILGIHALGREANVTGERATDGTRGKMVPAAHLLGGLTGGAVLMLAAWLLAAPVRLVSSPAITAAATAAVASAAIARDFGVLNGVGTSRQVPKAWLWRHGPVRAFFYYGAALGACVYTFAPAGLVFVVVAIAALHESLPLAIALGAALGGARAATVLAGTVDPMTAASWLYRGAAAHTRVRYLSVAGCLVAAGMAAASL